MNIYKKLNSVLMILLFTLVLGNLTAVFSKENVNSNYSLTIFVDEGYEKRNGHVFIGLTAGQANNYVGWYPTNGGIGALFGENGGIIKDDSKLADCLYDVKRTYPLTREQYQRAMNAVTNWQTTGKAWALQNHCGDFAETIAKIAGIQIELPQRATGRNRPELFGEYLRNKGGEIIAETFDVNNLVNTQMSVKKGDMVEIKATGSVEFGILAGIGGPGGIDYGTNYNIFYNIRHGSLIGRIRNSSSKILDGWNYIGEKIKGTAKISGTLELNVNDSQPDNNVGEFEVRVKVCKMS